MGSRDLELAPTALGGPMVTRCDLDVWLDADRFEPELRTGMLVVLEVEVVDPEPYSSYRVCMAPDAGGDPVCFDGLVIQDGKWLRLSVPRERLEADDYLVTVTGFGLGDPTELEERYDVRIQP